MTAKKDTTSELYRQLNHQKELLKIMHDGYRTQLQWASALIQLIDTRAAKEPQPQPKSNLRLVK
jgi:hypothetical protein